MKLPKELMLDEIAHYDYSLVRALMPLVIRSQDPNVIEFYLDIFEPSHRETICNIENYLFDSGVSYIEDGVLIDKYYSDMLELMWQAGFFE